MRLFFIIRFLNMSVRISKVSKRESPLSSACKLATQSRLGASQSYPSPNKNNINNNKNNKYYYSEHCYYHYRYLYQHHYHYHYCYYYNLYYLLIFYCGSFSYGSNFKNQLLMMLMLLSSTTSQQVALIPRTLLYPLPFKLSSLTNST